MTKSSEMEAKAAILDKCCQSVECLARGKVFDLVGTLDLPQSSSPETESAEAELKAVRQMIIDFVDSGGQDDEPITVTNGDLCRWFDRLEIVSAHLRNSHAQTPAVPASIEEIAQMIGIEFRNDPWATRRAAERVYNFLDARISVRAKTLARQATTSGLPHCEGQAVECDGGLHTVSDTSTVGNSK